MFDTLAHPDLIKNHYPNAWAVDVFQDRIEEALDRESLLRWLLGLATRATGASSGSIMLFDFGVFLVVLGGVCGILFALEDVVANERDDKED